MEKNLVRFVVLSVRAGTIGSKMKANKRDDCKIAKIKKLLAEDYGENHGLLVDDIKRVIYNLPKRKVIEWGSEFKDASSK